MGFPYVGVRERGRAAAKAALCPDSFSTTMGPPNFASAHRTCGPRNPYREGLSKVP